jgi:O-methyltransferase
MSIWDVCRRIAGVALDNPLFSSLISGLDHRSENRMSELGMIAHAFQFARINSVRGDYFEFGLWQGKTFRYARRMKLRYHLNQMTLWGFDSFEGLPRSSETRDNIWAPGQFRNPEDQLRRALKRAGFQDSEFELVPGFFCDSLNGALHHRMAGRTAAVVYVDCDLYESTRDVLRFVQRYLLNGSIVCFDDFYCFKGAPDQGEQRALREFLQAVPEFSFIPYFDYGPVGKSFIVRRQEQNAQNSAKG